MRMTKTEKNYPSKTAEMVDRQIKREKEIANLTEETRERNTEEMREDDRHRDKERDSKTTPRDR